MSKALTGFPAVNSAAIWLTSCGILWGRLGGEALYDKIPLWRVSHGCIYHPSNLGDSLPRKKVLRSNESGKEYAIPACWRLWEVLQWKNQLSIYQTDLIIRPLKKLKHLFWKHWRKWHPTPVFLPGNSHGQRSMAGCSPWDHPCVHKELDTTEWLTLWFDLKQR